MKASKFINIAIFLGVVTSVPLNSVAVLAITIVQPGYKVEVISTGSFTLTQPQGIAIDKSNNIYIGNNYFNGTSELLKISSAGRVSSIKTFPTFIGGLAINIKGEIFGSLHNQTIFKVERGTVTTFATGLPLYSAQQLVFDKQGNLFVAYFNGQSIYKVSRTGQVTKFVSNLEGPCGVAFKNGSLFIGDNFNKGNGPGVIKKVTEQGTVTNFFSAIPGRLVDLEYNSSSDSFFIANQGNVFDSGGFPAINVIKNNQITTFATGFNEFPRDIEFDRRGNLYVADSQKLYKISPTASMIKNGDFSK